MRGCRGASPSGCRNCPAGAGKELGTLDCHGNHIPGQQGRWETHLTPNPARAGRGAGSDSADRVGRGSHTPALPTAAQLCGFLGGLGCQIRGAGWGSEVGKRDGKEGWERGMGRRGWRSQKGAGQSSGGSTAEEEGPAEAAASLGKPQMCWSWNLWENSGTRKNFTPFSPAHISPLPSRSTGTATLGAPHSWHLHPKNNTNQAGSIPGSHPIQFPPHPSPTPPAPHLLPGKRGAGPVAALGEQLENRGTGGSFVGPITQREPFWVCSAEPCPIFPL